MKTLIIKKQYETNRREIIEKFRCHGWLVVIR